MPDRTPDLVLVHGAWHTHRVWDAVRARLESAGLSVAAPDLATDDPEAHTLEVVRAITGIGDLSRSLLVAHTSGALLTPVVAEQVPVGGLAMVNGIFPMPGKSFVDLTESPGWMVSDSRGRRYDRHARSFWVDKEIFVEMLAADCAPDEQERLWRQLRLQSRPVLRDKTPLTAWPDVPCEAWLYTDDSDLPVPWLRDRAVATLGVAPVEHPGSQLGFCADPEPLCDWLLAQLPG